MSYTKQTWATGDTVTAAKLNHMEDGIEGAGGGGGYDAVIVVGFDEEEEQPIATVESGSFSDFYSKFENGDRPSVQIVWEDPDGYGYVNVSSVLGDGDGGLIMQVYTLSVASGTSSTNAYGYEIGWNSSGITVSV